MRFWLVVHVLAAIAALGPEIAFGIMGPHARRQGSQTAAAVYAAVALARKRVVYPSIVVQIVSGIALIVTWNRSIREAWLASALVIYVLALTLVFGVLEPASARTREAFARGVEPSDPSLAPLLKRLAAGGGVAGAMLMAVAVLMVWKPGM